MKRTLIVILFCVFGIWVYSQAQNQEGTPTPPNTITGKTIIFDKPFDATIPGIHLPAGSISDGLNVIRQANMGFGWERRGGTTRYNTSPIASQPIVGIWQYVNQEHGHNQFYAQCNDAVYLSSANPPSTVASFGSSLYSVASGTSSLFGEKINDDMVFAGTGTTPFAYSGGTAYPDTVLTDFDGSGNTLYTTGYDRLRDNRTSTYLTIAAYSSSVSYWTYFGYRRPIEAISLNFLTGNTNDNLSSVTIQARRNGWVGVSGLVDGTAQDSTGVTTFNKDGRISWTYSSEDKPYLLPGTANQLYWYRAGVSAAIDTVVAHRARVHDRCATMSNLSSGYWDITLGCMLSTVTGWENYTPEVTAGSDSEYVSLDGQTKLYVAFANPAFAIRFLTVNGYSNLSTSAYLKDIKYWNGLAFTAITGVTQDGTRYGNYALGQPGVVQWDGNSILEQRRPLGSITTPLYWYELTWSTTLPDVRIWEVAQLEKADSFPGFTQYEGVFEYNGRAAFWPARSYPNGIDFAQIGYPYINNGPLRGSSGPIFGPGKVNAACRLSSYGMVSTKDPYRLYLLEGKNPGKWDELLIATNVGVVAPHSLVVIEDAIKRFASTKTVHAACFMAPDGVYQAERVVIKISDPISKYWDTGSTPYIEPSYMDQSYAWVDYKEKTVHFAVPLNMTSTSTTQSTLNYELIYNYVLDEWYPPTKRNNPARCGADIIGTDRQRMAYVGDYTGTVYRTDTGNSDNGNIIEHFITTGDMVLAASSSSKIEEALGVKGEKKLDTLSRLYNVRVISGAQSAGDIEVLFYPDGYTGGVTPSGTAGNVVSMINSGYKYAYGKVKTGTGGLLGLTHAMRFRSGVSGAELNTNMKIHGISVEYDIERQIGGP